MKKTWSCALAVALAVPAVGCKKESKPEGGATATTQQPAATSPAELAAMEKAAEKWVDQEFQPSTLSREKQLAEMKFFREAAAPFRGMKINVVSESIDTHVYESKTMAKAFSEITGIQLTHDLIQEGDVIEKLQTQMQSKQNVYDMYVNDSDLIGTHVRYGHVVPLSDFMAGEGKDVTLPTLDIDDFMGKSFVTGPDGKMYQLPDQQFANLSWFRYDWFSRPDLQERYKGVSERAFRQSSPGSCLEAITSSTRGSQDSCVSWRLPLGRLGRSQKSSNWFPHFHQATISNDRLHTRITFR